MKERPPGCRHSISISWRVMSCIIAAQLGLRRWTWCCKVVPHLPMGLEKKKTLLFSSPPSQSMFRTDRRSRAPFGSSSCLLSTCLLHLHAAGTRFPGSISPRSQRRSLISHGSKPALAAQQALLLLSLRDLANALSDPFCFPAA